MEDRARIPVSLPVDSPTTSYWQDPPSGIADTRTTSQLPPTADFVIVGSGISGTCIAYNLLQTIPHASIVMLEARQACSGATGRNGGHTKAASYRSFLDHEHEYGVEEAVKIARMEYANIKATHELARSHHIRCDSTECDTVDIIYSALQFENAKSAVARMQQVMGDDDPVATYRVWDAAETEKRFLTPGAVGSLQYEAGSLSAYSFTTGLLKLALQNGLNLQTTTPVSSIEYDEHDDAETWTAVTPRGRIQTRKLILATNGYTAHLLPELQGIIVPLHGQIVAQRPGQKMPQTGLTNTYSFIYETGYEYMITRPRGASGEGDIIIGGGLHQLPNSGASRYGNTDDTSLDPTITNYLRDCTRSSFCQNWGDDHPQGRIKQEWSGVMGASADGLPYVGQFPGKPGLWLCASFNGHGMVLCLKAAEALVGLMSDNKKAKTALKQWFPQAMLITKDRLHRRFNGRRDLNAPGEAAFGGRT